jgi:hypothetical protein
MSQNLIGIFSELLMCFGISSQTYFLTKPFSLALNFNCVSCLGSATAVGTAGFTGADVGATAGVFTAPKGPLLGKGPLLTTNGC